MKALARAKSAVGLLRDPFTGYPELYRRFGPVSEIGPYTHLLGPEANKFVFANAELFSWRGAFEPLIPVDGETALIVSDGEDHQRRRRLVTPAFSRTRIAGYEKTMAAHADRVIDTWRPGSVVDVYDQFRTAIRRATIEVLFGPVLAADEPVLGRDLQIALDLLDQSPLLQPVQQFLPAYRRAVAARARVEAKVRSEMARERSGDDVLGALLGSGLSDVEIVDQVISLIAAGYETTSAAMAWAVRALLMNPGESSLDDVVSETLRLYPPAVISLRKTVREFTYEGHRVRAGRFVVYSPFVTHRLEEVWPDPLRFDPSRWETGKPSPHEYLPFGGGPHRCVGSHFATTELRTMLARLRQRVSLELLDDAFKPTSLAAMRPRDGVRVRVLAVS
ncbi:cytochrome P450 [Amycolatopsis sp. cg5]|uniref:cytochrome P450 n=1 Tax=Amycolatopsis sp. cg5 TaxID=3238802 RepID=UPI003524B272